MDDIQKQKLQDLLSKGKWNYIIKYGILFWGLTTGTIMLLFFVFILDWGWKWDNILVNYVAFLFGGLLYGITMWKMLNNKLSRP